MDEKYLIGIMKFSRLITIGFLSLILTAFGIEATKAQRSTVTRDFVSLSSIIGTCRKEGSGSWYSDNGNISIGKRLYPYIGRVRLPYGKYTLRICKINPRGTTKPFGTFRFTFGIDEFSKNVPIEVKVYLNGKYTTSHTVSAGQIKTLLLDISNTEDMAIEISSPGSSPPLYILDDTLERLK